VAEHAYAAAFDDPRFPRLTPAERDGLSIHISVLGSPEPVPCRTEQELLSALRPGVDGLILRDGEHRATFLPTVWTQLDDPFVFVSQLKYKAALPLDYWSETIRFCRYTTESFPE
jgi:AmmeMemoRadiSam system protein A